MRVVITLKYIKKFFDKSPLKRWSLILLPLSGGLNDGLLSKKIECGENDSP